MTDPTQVPAELIAGDTWSWTRDLSADYPASAWTGAWYFEKAEKAFTVAAVASGNVFTATVAAATSAAYPAGEYRWRFVATRISDSVRKSVEQGWVKVLADPAAAGTYDTRTTARVMLDNIEAYLRDPTGLTASSYSLGGRSLSRWARADLLVERDKLKAEVKAEERREKLAAGVGVPRLQTRF